MSNLHCQVKNCGNNSQGLCSLNKIKIEGPGAAVSSQTCCFSFSENKGAQNSISSYASPETNIECKAQNCVHNNNSKCSANSITVNSISHNPSVLSETECSSFRSI